MLNRNCFNWFLHYIPLLKVLAKTSDNIKLYPPILAIRFKGRKKNNQCLVTVLYTKFGNDMSE